jgi:hypothetical protein
MEMGYISVARGREGKGREGKGREGGSGERMGRESFRG